jgi:hypothetical protein
MRAANLSLPSLVREPVAAFLCRPGAAPSLARLVLPEAWDLDLAGLGTATVRPAGLDREAPAALVSEARASCEGFYLPSMGPGLLLVERRLARNLVDVLLGLPMAAVAPPLSRIERGILGGVVAGAFGKLGLACGVHLAGAEAYEVGPDTVALDVSVRLDGVGGRVWLCATPPALVRSWEAAERSSGSGPAVLQIELARTRLPRSEAATALQGDIVVFEETAALSSSSSWPLQVCYRGRRVSVLLGCDGRVWADERTATTGRMAVGRRARASAGARVEVTAEIAHAIAADLPDGQSAGSVRGDGILLRMGESDWAEGVLSEVAGRLAVLITRTLAG